MVPFLLNLIIYYSTVNTPKFKKIAWNPNKVSDIISWILLRLNLVYFRIEH